MTPEQFKAATPVIQALELVNEQLNKVTEIIQEVEKENSEKGEQSKKVNGGMSGGYSMNLGEHCDMSGPKSLKLNGCWVGDAMWNAAKTVLEAKKKELEATLEAI
jgi:hypothetical protein